MSAKDKAWSKVLKYAAEIAREKRDPNKGNQHISWREAQKRAWKDPRVLKQKAEYHIKYDKKATSSVKKPKSAPGKRPRGRPPKSSSGKKTTTKKTTKKKTTKTTKTKN